MITYYSYAGVECSDDYVPQISNFPPAHSSRQGHTRNSAVGNSNQNTDDIREVIRGYEEERFCGACSLMQIRRYRLILTIQEGQPLGHLSGKLRRDHLRIAIN